MADVQIPREILEAAERGEHTRSTEYGDLRFLGDSSALDDEGAGASLSPYLPEELGSPPPEPRGPYSDESGKTLVLKEFTPERFAAWFAVQNVGAAPYNAVGIHHTYIPTSLQYRGIATLQGVFNYYANERGWPRGLGPHLWLIDGHGQYRHGQPLVAVGTHPRRDGIGIAYRNHRWLHIEGLFNGDAGRMTKEMEELFRFAIGVVCARRKIPVRFVTKGVDGPSQPLGLLFHRDVDPEHPPKSCPGKHTEHGWFDAAMRGAELEPSRPQQQRPEPGKLAASSGVLRPQSRILAKPRASLAEVQARLVARPHGGYDDDDVRWIARLYFETAEPVGLDPAIACAQMVHETNYLSSYWSQVPRRNPAGIGVTGEPGAGVSFDDWESAVRAHVGRLLAYAIPKGKATAVQGKLINEALAVRPLPDHLRGVAPTLKRLAGTWAQDPHYAEKVAKHASAFGARGREAED